VQFQTRTQQPSTASESANAPPVGMTFIASFFSRSSLTLTFTLYLESAEETLVNQPMETSSPSSPRAQPSPIQAETLTSPGI
jgi:hypothetical protein